MGKQKVGSIDPAFFYTSENLTYYRCKGFSIHGRRVSQKPSGKRVFYARDDPGSGMPARTHRQPAAALCSHPFNIDRHRPSWCLQAIEGRRAGLANLLCNLGSGQKAAAYD